MGDNWDDDEADWDVAAEKAVFKPAVGLASKAKPAAGEPDLSKFADEDQGEEPEPTHTVVKTQPKKKEEKKWMKDEAVNEDDTPLDDPIAEKMRRQRLIEQADLVAAKELFGDMGGLNLDAFLPKSVKDFEDYASSLAGRYILGHKDSKNYKAMLKCLIKQACQPLSAADSKEVESFIGNVRVEKVKEEKAAADAKLKSVPRKQLNTGGGKGKSAGLDDYIFDDAGDGDDDFM